MIRMDAPERPDAGYGMICPMNQKVTPPEFLAWLDNELSEKGWTDSQAARRAGLSHGAIYDIRSGIRPGAKKCRALAHIFGVPDEYVLRLAGHLPARIDPSGLPPETSELVRELNELLLRQPEPEQRRIMTAVLMLLRGAEVTITPLDEP